MMNWSDIAGDTPLQLLLLCVFVAFVAGVVTGLMARERINQEEEGDAGDTHMRMQWRDRAPQTLHRATLVPPATHTAPPPRPRVRAIGGALRPSYDASRQAAPPNGQHQA
jgi:hypothetical protein